MSAITTHVLDISIGRPADGVPVLLEQETSVGIWETVGQGKTDPDGRLKELMSPETVLIAGNYRITFDIDAYFAGYGMKGFHPEVTVMFFVDDTMQHYHVPLLLSPYGYSTYRGS